MRCQLQTNTTGTEKEAVNHVIPDVPWGAGGSSSGGSKGSSAGTGLDGLVRYRHAPCNEGTGCATGVADSAEVCRGGGYVSLGVLLPQVGYILQLV